MLLGCNFEVTKTPRESFLAGASDARMHPIGSVPQSHWL